MTTKFIINNKVMIFISNPATNIANAISLAMKAIVLNSVARISEECTSPKEYAFQMKYIFPSWFSSQLKMHVNMI